MRIVNTDNSGCDYPDEHFVNLPRMHESSCRAIAKIVNDHISPGVSDRESDRFYKVVDDSYILMPAFEP